MKATSRMWTSFVAGFVCKSVSTENTQRQEYGLRVHERTGKTGETFHGVVEYTRRFRPKLVICENVAGRLKRNRGCEPQTHSVRMAVEELGCSFAYNFLLPQ